MSRLQTYACDACGRACEGPDDARTWIELVAFPGGDWPPQHVCGLLCLLGWAGTRQGEQSRPALRPPATVLRRGEGR